MPLSQFISVHREEILQLWEDDNPPSRERRAYGSVRTIRDHLGELLQAIAQDLEAHRHSGDVQDRKDESWQNVQSVAQRHGAQRAEEGLQLEQMVLEFPALRESVTKLWRKSLESPTSDDVDDLTCFDEAIDFALTESVTEFVTQLNQSRETFIGILGHDLRGPIATIIAAAEVMHEEKLTEEKMNELAGRIVSTGKRMNQLVVDLLDFSRTRLGGRMPIERQAINLQEVVKTATTEFSTAHPDHPVEVDASGNLNGSFDDKRVSQAIGNLLDNALHHGAEDKPIAVHVTGDDQEVRIAVHNDGAPIPEDKRKHLFEPLSRLSHQRAEDTDPEHLGLGLYITRAIAMAHSGKVDVESSDKEGTTFTIHLPREAEQREEQNSGTAKR